MSLSRAQWQHYSRFSTVPCCPLHSHDQPELAKPSLSFPTFIRGRASGLILCSSGCPCASHLVLQAEWDGKRLRTIEEAQAAWGSFCEAYYVKEKIEQPRGEGVEGGK